MTIGVFRPESTKVTIAQIFPSVKDFCKKISDLLMKANENFAVTGQWGAETAQDLVL